MADLYSIPGITDEEAQKLRDAGFASPDVLWTKLASKDKDALKQAESATGLPAQRLATLLHASLEFEARPLKPAFLGRHWMDFAALFCIAVLVWALFFWGAGDTRVLARTELPVFHEIVPADLDVSGVAAAQRSGAVQTYAGHYTKRKLASGARLTPDAVASAPPDFKGLTLLRVSLKSTPADAERKPPYRATLVISADKPKTEAAAVVETTVLAYEKDPSPAVVVALRPEQVTQIGPLLGSSNAYLALPPR